MNQKEFVQLIADDINRKSAYVIASVGSDGKLVVKSRTAGPGTGLLRSGIFGGGESMCSGDFSKGNDEVHVVIVGNEGDTFFQRWDGVKTVPAGEDDVNQVVDIASVMLESHINLDGRTDIDRGSTKLASIDWSGFGSLNPVYSQSDSFLSGFDYDSSLNLDTYPSSFTWTLPKSANADIDEWTHITLASSLALDGDKGSLNALRRYQNSIIAFQDKGISEILFNSRTQLSTEQGVPVEIANSGKVDGKRYISNKYGVTNKWSIAEGKNGLYFVDNLNKAFCLFNGSVENLSEKLNFGTWFRRTNTVEPWRPNDFSNFVTFYDKIRSEVYLVRKEDESDEAPCLVYSETLKKFSSFYDYGSVPMMANVDDMFISFRDSSLWLQNEGLYCNFFGRQYGFWTTYRAVPEPYSDKIWTNLEYRADAYRILDESGNMTASESSMIDGGDFGDATGNYQKDETFNDISVWNEYQRTGNIANTSPTKKFRIWRFAVPRAIRTDTNRYGLDRIRNPWANLRLKKTYDEGSEENRDLMQIHDITVKYFE